MKKEKRVEKDFQDCFEQASQIKKKKAFLVICTGDAGDEDKHDIGVFLAGKKGDILEMFAGSFAENPALLDLLKETMGILLLESFKEGDLGKKLKTFKGKSN